ncbi:MAG: hypothetical protein JO030_02430 [Candidatus Eremiobacteraeota bacterium]|nr:hypothetical protein [Candidatus Eremiobacteraeota bacterium]
MNSDRFSTRVLASVALLGLITACDGAGSVPRAGTSGAAAGTTAAVFDAKQFGVGLGDYAAAPSTKASQTWRFQWCDGILENPSQCTGEVAGKRKYADNASGTATLYNGTASIGYTKAQITASQKLGVNSYVMYAETYEKSKALKNINTTSGIVSSAWMDTLYISSGSLKKGTPVTIGVKLKLTPQTANVACDSAQNSTGVVEDYSSSITGPGSSEFLIRGGCVNGSFGYYLYGSLTKKGTTATGTISTAVGNSYPLYFAADGYAIACEGSNYCVGDVVASLAGSFKFTITSITKGAAYTTASGNKY